MDNSKLKESNDSLDGVQFNKPRVRFSKRLGRKIHALYLEGHSFAAIARMPGMPDRSSIFLWKKQDQWFSGLMEGAESQRAELYADKAIDAAESATDKDEVPAARLKFDSYKWAAEVNDPDTYGKKLTHAGDKKAPITFIISTGFPAPNQYQQHPELGEDGLIKAVPILASADPDLEEEDSGENG